MSGLTSGAINTVTVQAQEFILDALQDARVIADGTSPSTNDYTDCIRKMNFLLKKFPALGILLWTRDLLKIPLQPNQTMYTVGPSGANVTSYRPLQAFDGTFVRTTIGGVNYDTSLRMLSRIEYMQTAAKSVTGVVNSWYYDPQMSAAAGPNTAYDPSLSYGIFYYYVTPQDSTYTAYQEVQRPLQEITVQTNTLDIPLETYDWFAQMLVGKVADKYEIPENRITRLLNQAKAAEMDLLNWSASEPGSVTWQPDPLMGLYNTDRF